MKWWVQNTLICVFWMLSFKPDFSLSFSFVKRLFSSSSLSAIRMVSSVYLSLLIFHPAILIPACASSSLAFCMYSAHKLNKQGDSIQPWHIPFPIWNQCIVPCPVLTVASWAASRFLRRQVRQSGIPIPFNNFPRFVVIHTVTGFGTVNNAEVDIFLGLSCFLYNPTDVDNLISDSSAFSKSSLNAWNFTVHVLLKPGLEILSITLLACEMSAIVW